MALAGCGAPGSGDEDEDDGGGGGSTTMDGTVGTVGTYEAGGALHESTSGGEGTSGSVEETLFGMSDDLPLVADIPSIKRDELSVGLRVVLEQVLPSTHRAELGDDAWIYVQDPTAEEHMGLRVLLHPSDPSPPEDRAVDLEGRLLYDAQGWLLELDSMVEGSEQPPVEPGALRVAELRSDDARVYDDALVEVVEPSSLVVTRRGPVSGTVLVTAVGSTQAAVLVDLRPFDVELDLPPGTRLSLLRGVAEIGGGRPVLLPRGTSDLVVAP